NITVPTLVLAHGADLLHPFSDASDLCRQLGGTSRLLRATSFIELRLSPDRLTTELAAFLAGVWEDRDTAARAAASPQAGLSSTGKVPRIG
ncbi:MAG TPA: hypothetical protein VGS21_01540, partial [Acidimicrobiales bacterium]|nr:hypothetical protein [Acidimicrobiales bacterium]